MPAAIYWLREAVRRNPADGDAHFVLGAALAAGAAARPRPRARGSWRGAVVGLRRVGEAAGGRSGAQGARAVKTDVELPHARIETTIADDRAARSAAARAVLPRSRAGGCSSRRTIATPIVELNRALYPLALSGRGAAAARPDPPAQRAGREAIDALKIALWSAETAEAHVALGEAYLADDDADAAQAEAERALASIRSPPRPSALLRAAYLGQRLEAASTARSSSVLKSRSLTHHTQDDGFHEIQLNGKQLVFLFMAATVVSVVIFLCGVLVGRGVVAERGAVRERIDRRVR